MYFDKEIPKASDILARKIANSKSSDSLNFAEPATTDETADGLYAMEDDYGTSYYYRGAVEDNYVKFAGFYWRIIRINGDGSLRIIYDGTQAHANGERSTDRLTAEMQVYNINGDDAKYVGYMYGPSGTEASTSKEEAQTNTENSDIKTTIESWYKTNIADKGYDAFVSDNIFCNDRTIPGKEETGWSDDTGLGYGIRQTAYGAYARLYHFGTNGFKPMPKFTCSQKNDAFTKEDIEKGNGKLGEKVGLITADEMVVAGGKYGISNSNFYLYKGFAYWSFSPHHNSYAAVFGFFGAGIIGSFGVYNTVGVAPVISLSTDYLRTMSGNGTMSSPFEA